MSDEVDFAWHYDAGGGAWGPVGSVDRTVHEVTDTYGRHMIASCNQSWFAAQRGIGVDQEIDDIDERFKCGECFGDIQ